MRDFRRGNYGFLSSQIARIRMMIVEDLKSNTNPAGLRC